jgi:hypothetical protein
MFYNIKPVSRYILCMLLLLQAGVANAQEESNIGTVPKFSVHMSSPLGLASKVRVKLEYISADGFAGLAGYTRYWGLYPGNQVMLEGRKYFDAKRRANFFIYTKVEMGDAHGKEYFELFVSNDEFRSLGNYWGVGAGAGWRLSYEKFFMEFSGGLQGVTFNSPQSRNYTEVFFITGPGAVMDLHFSIGLQFDAK